MGVRQLNERNDVVTRRDEVRVRRRAVMRVGLVVLMITSATACIFEKSDYKGGGRLDKGATAKTAEQPEPTAPTTQPTDASTEPQNPLFDAAVE
jgi:hypothetical protein